MSGQFRSVPESTPVGDEVAERAPTFEDFFHQEYARLYAALGLMTGNRAEAEELAQDAFLKLWERWDRVRRLEDPTGFLYRTALNLARSRHRRAKLALTKTFSPVERVDDFSWVDDRDVLVRALRGLIPQQRAAIVLTALLGFSSEEAGEMLGMKGPTVRTLSSRARAAMKETVGELS